MRAFKVVTEYKYKFNHNIYVSNKGKITHIYMTGYFH